MSDNKKQKMSKKKVIKVVLLVLAILLIFVTKQIIEPKPMLTIETPQKMNPSETKEIVLDVNLSTLGDALYPAASMSISFDPSRLEFLGIEEGNVFVHGTSAKEPQNLPNWSCNPDSCNETGLINIMYLDTTGGRQAFEKELLAKKDNVVLRLKFRLRGSVRAGDVCDLVFEDAIFAASDEKESLAMTTGTLKVRNGKIVIGE